MPLHIFKRALENRGDLSPPELFEKNFATLSDAQKRIQETIKENEFENVSFDNKDSSWWMRYKGAAYPRYQLFVSDDTFLKTLSPKK